MGLVLTLRQGEGFHAGAEQFRLKRIYGRTRFQIERLGDLHMFEIDGDHFTRIMVNVRAKSGLARTPYEARIMVEAPREIVIVRGNVARRGEIAPHASASKLFTGAERVRISDASEITGLTTRMLYRRATRGEIPGAAKFGTIWTFDLAKLREWIAEAERAASKANVASQPATFQQPTGTVGPSLRAQRRRETRERLRRLGLGGWGYSKTPS